MEGLGFYQWTSAFASFKFFARLLLMKLMNQWYEWSEPRTNRSSPKNVSSSFSTEKTRGLWWNLKPTIFFAGFSGWWPGAATTSATLGPRPGRRWAEIASVSPGSELLSSLDVPKNEGINGEIGWLVYVSYDYLVGGLEPWNIMTFHIYIYLWECHHPNWLSYFRGVETTNQLLYVYYCDYDDDCDHYDYSDSRIIMTSTAIMTRITAIIMIIIIIIIWDDGHFVPTNSPLPET